MARRNSIHYPAFSKLAEFLVCGDAQLGSSDLYVLGLAAGCIKVAGFADAALI
jgi:hypothetical protein